MIKKFLLLLFLSLISLPAFSEEIQFKAHDKPSLLIENDSPMVYRPTKLIIGQENSFIIKAKPGYYVSLATSYSDSGAPLFYGQKLRLGSDIKTLEGVIPENGVLEMKLKIPKDKDLVGKILYFEVAVWKSKDFKDLRIAKIMAANGRESSSNAVTILPEPKNVSCLQ